jgi:DNA-binding NtrC family response regulator
MQIRSAPKLILIDVTSPYRDAFSRWSVDQDLDLVSCDREAALSQTSGAALCVYQSASGDDLLRSLPPLLKTAHGAPIVILSASVTVAQTVRLMDAGVKDVIELPASPTDVVARAAVRASSPADAESDHELVGRGAAMTEVRQKLSAVAPLASTVLFTGETGTGKGLAVRTLHAQSKRRDHPLVHVDCSALSGSLIESELFGHERGAFTGAATSRRGRFEMAEGGTIFLDEVGELSPALQSKLLRVLQDRVYERVGGTKTRLMSARVVAATNRDLNFEVRSGRFRRDLLYRLNVFHIRMPPLRERLEDLPLLAQVGLGTLAKQLMVTPPPVSDSFYERLAAHDWPGNVRELMNVLERLMIRYHAGLADEVSIDDLLGEQPRGGPPRPRSPEDFPPRGSEEERALFEAELAAVGGNVSRAARRLGLARSTLRYRLALHDLESLIPDD